MNTSSLNVDLDDIGPSRYGTQRENEVRDVNIRFSRFEFRTSAILNVARPLSFASRLLGYLLLEVLGVAAQISQLLLGVTVSCKHVLRLLRCLNIIRSMFPLSCPHVLVFRVVDRRWNRGCAYLRRLVFTLPSLFTNHLLFGTPLIHYLPRKPYPLAKY